MRDRRNTFEVGEGLLYKGEEERIEQEEQYPEKRDFCFLWCHIAGQRIFPVGGGKMSEYSVIFAK